MVFVANNQQFANANGSADIQGVALAGYSYAGPTGAPAGFVRIYDANLVSLDYSVKINGFPPGLLGALLWPHGPAPHNLASKPVVTTGSKTVNIGNIPVARVTSTCSCGDTVQQGSRNVKIGS